MEVGFEALTVVGGGGGREVLILQRVGVHGILLREKV